MLAHAPKATRLRIRIASIALLVIGAVGVAVMMFLGAAYARPWHMGAMLATAGIGLWGLRLPVDRVPSARQNSKRPVLLMLGIFFTFGTMGPLLMMVFEQPPMAVQAGLVAVVLSGGIAVMWASAFVFRKWWLIPTVILLQVFVPVWLFNSLNRVGLLRDFFAMSDQMRLGGLALCAVASLVAGYAMVVRYIRAGERDQARAAAELELAASLHAHLVPAIEGSHGSVRYLARSIASAEMGGDLVHVLEGATHTDIVIADVSGHGIKAGVVMAMVKAGLQMRRPDDTRSLAAIMSELDAMLERSIQPGMFVTAAGLRVRQGSGQDSSGQASFDSEVVIAGHPPILHYRGAAGVVDLLESTAMPLGLDGSQAIQPKRITLRMGDLLMLFTDGLNETTASSGEHKGKQLGITRLAGAFAEHAARHGPDAAGLRAMHNAIMKEVRQYGEQADDRTLVLVAVG